MLFNTIDYIIFLPLVILAYYLLPFRFRWMLLLAASYFFYMCWKFEYVLLIMGSTIVDYTMALIIERQTEKKKRRRYLLVSLAANLGLLFYFKYSNFVFINIDHLLEAFHFTARIKASSILLPVGISFYTFQSLSYTIEVYQGKQKAERHLGYFALYVCYFPQLVAGPIERYARLAPQLQSKHLFDMENIKNGLRLILFGLFIKMVVADNICVYVDKLYADPAGFNTKSILSGLFLYSFQIYSDFAGYSLVAIGSALLMGVRLMDNFKTPYLAKNIAEFWQRWHISLSTWFRDYLYIPLGGNRVTQSRWAFNIFVVFTVSGIWHGANWTFVIWGALFGIIYLIEHFANIALKINKVGKPYSPLHLLLSLKTFVLVTLIWIFFRSQNLQEVAVIFKSIFANIHAGESLQVPIKYWIFVGLLILSDFVLYNKRFDTWTGKQFFVVRWAIYAVLIFSILVCSGVEAFPFIYFQF